jgi:NADH pyrophosphatase NudC (nudix superfamily)
MDLFKYCPRCGSPRFTANNFKSKKCERCGFTYFFNPAAATAAFITDRDGRLLVARRAKEPAKGTFDLPGGFIDANESAEDAIRREVEEETGLPIDRFGYLFSLPNVYPYSGMQIHTVDLFFQSEIDGSTPVRAADDVEALFWIPKNLIEPERFGLTSIRRAIEIWLKSTE